MTVQMKKRAKYLGKWFGTGYDRDFVYMDYEYRGREYTVYENRAKGNIPLAWQHQNHQSQIDRQIEIEEACRDREFRPEDSWEHGFDMFWESVQ